MRQRCSNGVVGLAALAALLALGACTSNDGRTDAPRTSAAERSTTSTTSSASAAIRDVEQAYRAAQQAFTDATTVPDPDHPRFLATHVDPLLTKSRNFLLAMKVEGQVGRIPDPSVARTEIWDVEIEGDVARLQFCDVDDTEIIEVATGRVIRQGPETVQGRAGIRRVDGEWKLAEQLFGRASPDALRRDARRARRHDGPHRR